MTEEWKEEALKYFCKLRIPKNDVLALADNDDHTLKKYINSSPKLPETKIFRLLNKKIPEYGSFTPLRLLFHTDVHNDKVRDDQTFIMVPSGTPMLCYDPKERPRARCQIVCIPPCRYTLAKIEKCITIDNLPNLFLYVKK
jgi:hypothetical protein